MYKKLSSNKILSSISTLIGGTFIAQLIAIGALPFLTRLYSPDDFSVLAFFLSILILVSSFAGLRYEVAVPNADNDKSAFSLVVISIISAFFISIIVFFAAAIIEILNLKYSNVNLGNGIWLLPLAIFLTATCTSLQYWFSRKKNFGIVAKNRIAQVSSSVTVQLLCGYFYIGYLGLIIGQIFNGGGGLIYLIKNISAEASKYLRILKFNELRAEFHKNISYVKYSTPETIANNGAVHIPILIMSFYADSAEIGFLFLAMRVIQIPMGILVGAVSQVYYVHSKEKEESGVLTEFTANTLINIIKFGVGPILFFGFIAPFLIKIIFGDEWIRTGYIIQWLLAWFVFQTLASPISMIMYTKEKQKEMLYLTSFGFLLRVISIWYAALYFPDFLIEVYSISGAIFYLVCLFVFMNTAKLNYSDLIFIIKKSFATLIFWIAGLIFVLSFLFFMGLI
jgi:O-antigen/teichoic acid export membrane protein